MAIPGADIYVQKGGPELSQSLKKVPLGNLPSRVAAAAIDIRTAAAGSAVLLDWLLSGGKPVDPDLANGSRGHLCGLSPQRNGRLVCRRFCRNHPRDTFGALGCEAGNTLRRAS